MQSTLDAFRETESQDSFSLQNNKLLKVELNQVTIQAKLGSMVAYQGDVRFEHAGSGGLGRMVKKAVTGEGTRLMKMEGTGEVFLADQAQDVHLIQLEQFVFQPLHFRQFLEAEPGEQVVLVDDILRTGSKLQEMKQQKYVWSGMLGCYVGKSGVAARGVPDGFLGP